MLPWGQSEVSDFSFGGIHELANVGLIEILSFISKKMDIYKSFRWEKIDPRNKFTNEFSLLAREYQNSLDNFNTQNENEKLIL